MKTVVVIPTYDERENVARMSEAVLACGVEVLFVDDNSPDGTGDVLDSLAAHSPRVHVLHRERKAGRSSGGSSRAPAESSSAP